MRVFVTGGTGFVGSRLIPFLLAEGMEIHLLVREQELGWKTPPGVEVMVGDPMRSGPWWDGLRRCQAAVNLAGYPVFSRWDAKTKALIRESRLATTRNLVNALPDDRPFTLVSASGLGIYGERGDAPLGETEPPGSDFLAGVAAEWEAQALAARERGVRVALTRFGIIFGAGGGALPEFVRTTRRFLGGPLAGGRQWMPWIHREDVVRGIEFLLRRQDLSGPFNFCAPNPRRQREVARELGRQLGRPSFVPAPAFALRLILGECAEVALASQRGVPHNLLEAGFVFRFPELAPALADILPRQMAAE